MQKEIFEQPRALATRSRGVEGIVPDLFGDNAYRCVQRRRTVC